MSPQNTDHPQYEPIGKVIKVHGLKGEVVIGVDLPEPEQLLALERVYILDSLNMMRPYRLLQRRVSEQGNRQSFFVLLENVSDRTQASTILGKEVLVDGGKLAFFEDDDEMSGLIGYTIVDASMQKIGEVVEVMETPAHPLLKVHLYGKGAILIPFVDAYVTEVNDDDSEITVMDIEPLIDL
jgi:16S rRNA processing protein RimM